MFIIRSYLMMLVKGYANSNNCKRYIIDEEIYLGFVRIPNCKGIMVGHNIIGNCSMFKKFIDFFNSCKELSLPTKTKKMNDIAKETY